MYNFALAFVVCCIVYLIGEAVSNITKAWIPSVFVTAAVLIVGYWTIIPKTLITDSALIPFGSTTGIYLLLVHMGSIISLKQLAENWKTVVVCLLGLTGMCAFAFIFCPMLMDYNLIIAGLPPLTGGIVAATTMMDAAQEAGLQEAAVFAIVMYCMQGFAGYPLTAICLQLEGKAKLKEFRAGKMAAQAVEGTIDADSGNLVKAPTKAVKKLVPPLPDKWNNNVMIFLKMGILAWIATQIGSIQFPYIGAISGAVWALLVGIFATAIGLLDENALNKSNSYGIVMFALMMYVFDGLNMCTPEMLLSIIVPMIELIVIGVVGMGLFCFVGAKILKMSFKLAFATALTALYGFPPNAIITENTCTALAETPEEKEALMGHMFTPMIVGGFTTVTITSVIIAGVFTGMFV